MDPLAPTIITSSPAETASRPLTSTVASTPRRSFLSKLPVTLPIPKRLHVPIRRPPHPNRFIPFRSGAIQRAKLNERDPNAKPLGRLVVRVLAARGLVAKDRNGLSDPFLVMRYAGKSVTSTTITKTLDPVWPEGSEAKLELPVSDSRSFAREAIEIVVWDKDRVGKQYLGEVSLGLDTWWGGRDTWGGESPPIGLGDVGNTAKWHPIRSTRSRATVSGDLLVLVGFASDDTPPSAPSGQLSDVQRQEILSVLRRLSEEAEGSRRASKEERVLLAAPTEGVGTTPIGENLQPGTNLAAVVSAIEDSGSESDLSDTSDDDLDGEDEEGEKDLSTSASDSEGEGGEEAEAVAPVDYFNTVSSPEPADQSSESLSPLMSPLSIMDTPSSTPSTTIPSSSQSISPELPVPLKSIHSRRGLRLPSFMKRTGSSKSVSTRVESEGNSDAGPSGSGDNQASSTTTKEKRRRFSRKKSRRTTEEGTEEIPPKAARRRLRKSGGTTTDGGTTGKKLKRRQTKRDYQYEAEDNIFGLVQIEIRSAHNLPRFSNMLRTSWDMDPFVVCSFGRKVFRTRVIRHSLNPTWDEKLFFHVRRTEVGWSLNFNIYDYDNLSSNDHVGDVSVPLEELLGTTLEPDARGLYPTSPDGKLFGDDFIEHSLNVQMENPRDTGKPTLEIRAKFTPYDALRQQFWRKYLRQYDIDESGAFSHLELFSALDSLGSTLSKATIASFFSRFGKTTDDELTADEVVICLEYELRKPMDEKRPVDESQDNSGMVTPALGSGVLGFSGISTPTLGSTDPSNDLQTLAPGTEVVTNPALGITVKAPAITAAAAEKVESPVVGSGLDVQLSDEEGGIEDSVERVINIRECPLCRKPRMTSKAELDIITHLGICASTDPRGVNRIVVGNYVTSSQAQRKWFTKAISKATRGAYSLGANSANIIVQDRQTGMLQEEKISVYVRLGIRLAYKGVGAGGGMEGARIRRMLESMSIKQGVRFNSPNSVREIQPFIAFHNLNIEEVLDPMDSFKTFNEFFYRKLNPNARPVSDPSDPRTLVSPADCRGMFFETINDATTFWIKGREFSLSRLLGDAFKEDATRYEGGSLAIFRLAPQDYHRFHSPVDGIMGRHEKIAGKYFTVNPMAIRSAIDVYGENVRVVAPIHSPVFGQVQNVWVGAMLVGSICMTKNEGEEVTRGEEVGYFAFGGSTIITIFEKGQIQFDEDLLTNSKHSLETLVRMGSRIGRKI